MTKKTNALSSSGNPYLRQHAENPVNWVEWSDEAFSAAREQNKTVLVSIGYSACHWCHVMAHESFEDEKIAEIMNSGFVCIKVDREEHPDIDNLYMAACQIMTGRGGWPLNVFVLPDRRPFHAGTYYQKEQWANLLLEIRNLNKTQPSVINEYAGKLETGIKQSFFVSNAKSGKIDKGITEKAYQQFANRFDNEFGGLNHSPKFPMPGYYRFLLDFGIANKHSECIDFVSLTLNNMAKGGMYDAVGGGFCRYSVDNRWFLPHFEKMLYDNAALISLYTMSWKSIQNPFYKEIALQTTEFCIRELLNPTGYFYSALDADSEGIEGKYYRWSFNDLVDILGEDANGFSEYFHCSEKGNWEEGFNILYAVEKPNLSKPPPPDHVLNRCLQKLKKVRDKRIKPGLDNKGITSWNGLMLTALADIMNIFTDFKYQKEACNLANLLIENYRRSGNLFYRLLNDSGRKVSGFAEDYAFVTEGFIKLYQSDFNEKWLLFAKELTENTIQRFYHGSTNMFSFTEKDTNPLIAYQFDITDDVIDSSNAVMAENLIKLGSVFGISEWIEIGKSMVENRQESIETAALWHSRWARNALYLQSGFYLCCLVGEDVNLLNQQYKQLNVPNCLVLSKTSDHSDLPVLKDKIPKKLPRVYICRETNCLPPSEGPVHEGLFIETAFETGGLK